MKLFTEFWTIVVAERSVYEKNRKILSELIIMA